MNQDLQKGKKFWELQDNIVEHLVDYKDHLKNNIGGITSVLKNGYCVGCGACAALAGSPFSIIMNEYGQYTAINKEHSFDNNKTEDKYSSVCPFSDASKNEDEIAKNLDFKGDYFPGIGYYEKLFCGHVKKGSFRVRGSSGGLGTWIPYEMVRKGIVDGIIHVKSCSEKESFLFKYFITYGHEQAIEGAKSRYYPVEFSKVLREIKKSERTYVFIGVPCFVKAIRLLSIQDEKIQEQIPYAGSIFCGHLKSTFFAENMAWESGIKPNNMKSIDFRKKLKFLKANHYGVELIGKKNNKLIKRFNFAKSYLGGDWGAGIFKYRACDFCDDMVGETADFSVGDAWIDKYVNDSMGNNVLIVRSPVIWQIVKDAKLKDELALDDAFEQDVLKSQKAGYKNKRELIAYRLFKEIKMGRWVPRKRVKPSDQQISYNEKVFQDMRSELSKISLDMFRKAKECDDYRVFENSINIPLKKYYFKKKNRFFYLSWQVMRFFTFRLHKLISIISR